MEKRLIFLPVFFVSFIILLVSFLKSASIEYAFSLSPSPAPESFNKVEVDYLLPDPLLTPESPFWFFQAVFDRFDKNAQDYLENADARLVAGLRMLNKGKIEESIVVFQKAEQYLRKSYDTALSESNGQKNGQLLYRISLASLKHREILESVLVRTPEDGRAVVVEILDIPKAIYEGSIPELIKQGLNPPEYPF